MIVLPSRFLKGRCCHVSGIGLFSQHVNEFVVAGERLMCHDAEPQALTGTHLEAIRYYVKSVSANFTQPPALR
jgi:hypothetical protein